MTNYILNMDECRKVAKLCGWWLYTSAIIGDKWAHSQDGDWYPIQTLQPFIHDPLNIGYLLMGLVAHDMVFCKGTLDEYEDESPWVTISKLNHESGYCDVQLWWPLDIKNDPIGHRALLECLKQIGGGDGRKSGMSDKRHSMTGSTEHFVGGNKMIAEERHARRDNCPCVTERGCVDGWVDRWIAGVGHESRSCGCGCHHES